MTSSPAEQPRPSEQSPERWALTIASPMGEIAAELSVAMIDGAVRGEMIGKGGTGPLEDGQFDGDAIRWACRIERPMPMRLKFKGTRSGDRIEGSVKFGLFASGIFSAQRL